MHSVLVVANRTSASPTLLDAVSRRASESPCTVTLLVPRSPHGLHRVVDPEDHGHSEAAPAIEHAPPPPGRPPARAPRPGGGGRRRGGRWSRSSAPTTRWPRSRTH